MAVLSEHFLRFFSKNSFLIKDIIRIAGNVCERVISGEGESKTFFMVAKLPLMRYNSAEDTFCRVETLAVDVLPLAKLDLMRYNHKIESTDERKKQNGKHVQRSHPL